MQRCTRCTLPVTYPGLSLDEKGVCQRCRVKHEVVPLGMETLDAELSHYRDGDRPYDALVGLSGGRDSTYALYYAVVELKLRVLAFTIDNGFIPRQTWENVDRAVKILGVEHVVVKHKAVQRNFKSVLRAWLRHPSPAMLPALCTGCRLGLNRSYARLVKEYQTPLVITGSGEPESSFALSFFGTNYSLSAASRFLALVKGLITELVRNPWYLRLHPPFPYWLALEYLYAFSPGNARKYLYPQQMKQLRLFEYIGWDENKIMSLIQERLEWANYSYSRATWRSDCKISLLRNYLYYRSLGFTKNDELVSNLIRLGLISRDEGLARVKSENTLNSEFISSFLSELDLTLEEFSEGMVKVDRSYEALVARLGLSVSCIGADAHSKR